MEQVWSPHSPQVTWTLICTEVAEYLVQVSRCRAVGGGRRQAILSSGRVPAHV